MDWQERIDQLEAEIARLRHEQSEARYDASVVIFEHTSHEDQAELSVHDYGSEIGLSLGRSLDGYGIELHEDEVWRLHDALGRWLRAREDGRIAPIVAEMVRP